MEKSVCQLHVGNVGFRKRKMFQFICCRVFHSVPPYLFPVISPPLLYRAVPVFSTKKSNIVYVSGMEILSRIPVRCAIVTP